MYRELETDRLRLKNIGCDDARFIHKQFSTDAVNAFLYDAEPIASDGEAMELIDFYTREGSCDRHRWIIILKASGEKIGTCGFHRLNRGNGTVEVGYDLQPAFWRQGYMSEALEAIVGFARTEMDVKTVFAHIALGNEASARTASKAGFYMTDDTYFEEFHGEKYLHCIYRLDL